MAGDRSFKQGDINYQDRILVQSGSEEALIKGGQWKDGSGGGRVGGSGDSEIDRFGSNRVGWHRKGSAIQSQIGFENTIGSKEGTQEIQTCSQFETAEFTHTEADMQIRGSQCGTQDGEEELLDVHIRSEGGLLPCGNSSRLHSFPGHSLEGQVVQVQGPPIWSQPFAMGLHESGQRTSQALEIKGNTGDCIPGRLSGDGHFKGRSIVSSFNDTRRLGQVRLASGVVKGNVGPFTISGVSWLDNRFKGGSASNSIAKGQQAQGDNSESAGISINDGKSGGIIGRNSDQRGKSVFASKTLHPINISSTQVISEEEMGMGGGNQIHTTDIRRLEVDHGKHRSVQWNKSLEASSDPINPHRCIEEWMGIPAWGAGRRGTLDSGANIVAHQQIGIASDPNVTKGSTRSLERKEHSDIDRLNDSKEQLEQQREFKQGDDRHSSLNMAMGNLQRFNDPRSRMDSWDNKHSGRLREQTGGFSRLDSVRGDLSIVGDEMGSSFSGQDGIKSQHKADQVQFSSLVSRNTRNQLLQSGLESRQQLRGPSFHTNSQGSQSHIGVSGSRYIGGSKVGGSTMVATPSFNDRGSNRIGVSNQSNVQSRTIRNGGTIQEPIMEVSGSQSEREKRLMDRVKKLQTNALAKSTQRTYDKHWEEYEDFCKNFNHRDPLQEHSILLYLGWLDELGSIYKATSTLAIIGRQCKIQKQEDISQLFSVREAFKGIQRLLGEKKGLRKERLPFPVSALISYILDPGRPKDFIWMRDCALVTIGLRCMRRASELTAIRREDLTKDGDMYLLRIPRQKNDQTAAGAKIPFEKTGNPVSCPVKILDKFLAAGFWIGNDFLFQDRGISGQMSTGAVSAVVKRMADQAGLDGRYSSHSLRIGGATAGMRGGLSLEQIMSIGCWKSISSAMIYMRAFGAAQAMASSAMGF